MADIRLNPWTRRSSAPIGAALGIVGLLALAVLVGLSIGVFGLPAAAAMGSLLALVAAMVVPVEPLFVGFLVIVFVVTGQLQYFGRIDKAFWLPYLLCLVLGLRLLSLQLAAASTRWNAGRSSSWPADLRLALVLLFVHWLVVIASALINGIGPLQWLVAGKEYFFLAVVLAVFASNGLRPGFFERALRLLPWFLMAQVPVVVYQRFVVAAHRVGGSPWDAVVGLFGGNPQGGGASGTMGIFSVLSVALLVEAWKARKLDGLLALAGCICAVVACALAEVKLVIVLLPLIGLYTFGGELRRRPMLGIGGLLLGVLVTIGMLVAYQQQYASSRTAEGRSLEAYVSSTIERNSGARATGSLDSDMGRVAAIRFWAREQSLDDPVRMLVGHGIGASRFGSLVVGELVRKYQMRIGRSALTVHLWEVGLLGAAALVAALALAALTARRMSNDPALQAHRWLLRAATVSLGVLTLGLAYGPDFVEVAQYQVLVYLFLGLLVQAARFRAQHGRPVSH